MPPIRTLLPNEHDEWLRLRLAPGLEGDAAAHRAGMEQWLHRPDGVVLVAPRGSFGGRGAGAALGFADVERAVCIGKDP